jgi:cytochrome b561
MQKNTASNWSSVAKTIHWTTVLLIAVVVPAGFLMTATYGASFRDEQVHAIHLLLAQIHHTIGLGLLLLVAVRTFWRLKNPVPALPGSPGRLQQWLARGTHWAFYGLLFLLPLSGWAAMSVLGDTEDYGDAPVWFFGWDGLPPILPQRPLDDPFGYSFMASIHRYAVYAGGVLLLVHVLAALWHHLVRRDAVLLRMWPGTSSEQRD